MKQNTKHLIAIFLACVAFLVLLLQGLFEFLMDKTGRRVLRVMSAGRIRAREHTEPDPNPFHMWWRDQDGIVVSDGTPMMIGMLFWLLVAIIFLIACEALFGNPN
jgi:hypothetical protein